MIDRQKEAARAAKFASIKADALRDADEGRRPKDEALDAEITLLDQMGQFGFVTRDAVDEFLEVAAKSDPPTKSEEGEYATGKSESLTTTGTLENGQGDEEEVDVFAPDFFGDLTVEEIEDRFEYYKELGDDTHAIEYFAQPDKYPPSEDGLTYLPVPNKWSVPILRSIGHIIILHCCDRMLLIACLEALVRQLWEERWQEQKMPKTGPTTARDVKTGSHDVTPPSTPNKKRLAGIQGKLSL